MAVGYRVVFSQLAVSDEDGIATTYRQGDLMPVPDSEVERMLAEGKIERVEPEPKHEAKARPPAPAKGAGKD